MMKTEHKKELKRIYGELEQAKADLEQINLTLEEAIEEKSDKWKESEAGEAAQGEIDNIQACIDELENAYGNIQEYTS